MMIQHVVREYGEDTQRQRIEKAYGPNPVPEGYPERRWKDTSPWDTCNPRSAGADVENIVLESIFEADFKDYSFGFQPKRNAKQAMQRIHKMVKFGRVCWGIGCRHHRIL
jgi:RNA-directed DNA polymerase